ncbi:MAG: Flp pilus assembly complex ATPase component TadA, partial [Azoarcus sp.]|nr:Flp pilus assembly complex ATPase component TadA [Azoarcus sp.]
MHRIILKTPDGSLNELMFGHEVVTIGRDEACDIVIKGWSVGKRHAEIRFAREGARIFCHSSLMGIGVNGERIKEYGPLQSKDEIQVGNYSLFVIPTALAATTSEKGAKNGHAPVDAPREFAATRGMNGVEPRMPESALPRHATEKPARPRSDTHAEQTPVRPQPREKTRNESPPDAPDLYLEWRKQAHAGLIKLMDVRRTDITTMSEAELEQTVRLMVDVVLESMKDLPKHIRRDLLAQQVLDEAIGLGPLEPLLADETVTEVMVNASDQIFVERAGKIVKSLVSFTNDRAVISAIERIVAPIGRKIDESSPLVDARLKDGSRVNAVIPPLALKGPSITIRKFPKNRLYGEDLLKFGTLNEAMLEFLSFCVLQAKNIIISGGTGSGKTTLLNILSNFIPDTDRIVTVEDAAELRLHQPNLVSLEARPANSEGKGAIPIRELVKNCLRMRPDRIVVGECRGGEALDMLQAMNTGHDGSLTTAHANS